MHRFRVLTLCVGLAAGSSVMLAADKGDAPGMTNLGWLYAGGRGVAQDYGKGCTMAFAAEPPVEQAVRLQFAHQVHELLSQGRLPQRGFRAGEREILQRIRAGALPILSPRLLYWLPYSSVMATPRGLSGPPIMPWACWGCVPYCSWAPEL